MSTLRDHDGNELHNDGTRRMDNTLLQIIDRANGTARRRLDEAEDLQRREREKFWREFNNRFKR